MKLENLTSSQFFLSLPSDIYKSLDKYTEEEYEFFRLFSQLLLSCTDLPPYVGCVRAIGIRAGIQTPKWALLELKERWSTVDWEKELNPKKES